MKLERKRKRSKSPVEHAADDHDDRNDAGGGTESTSLSVAESNKLRISLGLAPLDEGPSPSDAPAEARFTDDGHTIVVDPETKTDFVHKPADSWTDRNKQTKLKEKLEAAKLKREFNAKTSSVTLLSARDDDADNAGAWVDKMRDKEEAKRQAAAREAALSAMDDEFGVSALLEEKKKPVGGGKRSSKSKSSKSGGKGDHLAGMAVEHSADDLVNADADTILVLKDKGVLDDGEETLVNPTMIEFDQWTRNTHKRNKNKKSGLALYEEEVDEWGKVQEQRLLGKYDEDEDGQYVKSSFRLDESGGVNLADDKQRTMIREKLRLAQEVSLESKGYTVANEYYTHDEMDGFKKKKKMKRNERKRQKGLTADELLADAPDAKTDTTRDRGSRAATKAEEESTGFKAIVDADGMDVVEEEDGAAPPVVTTKYKAVPEIVRVDKSKMRIAAESDDESSDESLAGGADVEDWTGIVDDDAADELHSQLQRTRKLALQQEAAMKMEEGESTAKRLTGAEAVALLMSEIKDEPVDMETDTAPHADNVIVLDSVSEYARNLGDTALAEEHERQEKQAADTLANANKSDTDEGTESVVVRTPRDKKRSSRRGDAHSTSTSTRHARTKDTRGRWTEEGKSSSRHRSSTKDVKKEEPQSDSEDEEMTTILGKEANLSMGVGAALAMARDKGYLTASASASAPGCSSMLGLENVPKMKALASRRHQQVNESHDIEDKYRKKLDTMGRSSGPSSTFRELAGYEPMFQIAYVDDKGRKLEQKEAWQQLCWKFHGRYPSKRQVEKKLRRMDQQQSMTQMNPLDTPLGSLVKQCDRQERLQQPYLVLSGKGSGIDLAKESYPKEEPTTSRHKVKKYKKTSK